MCSTDLAKNNGKRRPLSFGVNFSVEFPQRDDVAVRSNQLNAHIALRNLNLIAFGSFVFIAFSAVSAREQFAAGLTRRIVDVVGLWWRTGCICGSAQTEVKTRAHKPSR
jgi:hypothetical protein